MVAGGWEYTSSHGKRFGVAEGVSERLDGNIWNRT